MTLCPRRRLFRRAPHATSRLTSACAPPRQRSRIQPLIDFFEAILQFFHDTVGAAAGASRSSLLTILVRACLLPLTLKQFKSMQALATLAARDEEAPGAVQGRQGAPATRR